MGRQERAWQYKQKGRCRGRSCSVWSLSTLINTVTQNIPHTIYKKSYCYLVPFIWSFATLCSVVRLSNQCLTYNSDWACMIWHLQFGEKRFTISNFLSALCYRMQGDEDPQSPTWFSKESWANQAQQVSCWIKWVCCRLTYIVIFPLCCCKLTKNNIQQRCDGGGM